MHTDIGSLPLGQGPARIAIEERHLSVEFTVSPLTIESYDDILALWQQCQGIGLSDGDSKQNIRSYLERNPGTSFIARADGAVVRAVLAGHDGRRGYVHHLAVHPDYRRQGVGRRLVDKCVEVLRHAGIRKCHTFIFNGNSDGIAFWKSAGWTHRQEISVISKSTGPSARGGGS